MKLVDTYYIEYGNGKAAWLAPNATLDEFTDITSTTIRKMIVADEGKSLFKGDEEIGSCIWLKDDDSQDNYTEGEPTQPTQEENTQELDNQ